MDDRSRAPMLRAVGGRRAAATAIAGHIRLTVTASARAAAQSVAESWPARAPDVASRYIGRLFRGGHHALAGASKRDTTCSYSRPAPGVIQIVARCSRSSPAMATLSQSSALSPDARTRPNIHGCEASPTHRGRSVAARGSTPEFPSHVLGLLSRRSAAALCRLQRHGADHATTSACGTPRRRRTRHRPAAGTGHSRFPRLPRARPRLRP